MASLEPRKSQAKRRLPSRTTLLAVAAGAAVFWGPPLALSFFVERGEKFHLAIALNAVLVPLAMFLGWCAWFDAPTRAERLGRWVRMAIAGPYAGAVIVGALTFFLGPEFHIWSDNPRTPAASGVLLPIALFTVKPGQMLMTHSMFAAAPVLLIITLLIPKGAHRPLDH